MLSSHTNFNPATYDVQAKRVSVADATITVILPADSNRIGVNLAALVAPAWAVGSGIVVGPIVDGSIVPVATLTPDTPTAFLCWEKLGWVPMAELSALGNVGAASVIGVTAIRVNNPSAPQ